MSTSQHPSEEPASGGMATALSPTSLKAQIAVSPLYEALLILAKQPTKEIHPSHGCHGLIDAIPFGTWVDLDHRIINLEVTTLEKTQLLSTAWCVNLLRRGLPTPLRDQLLGVSTSDSRPPKFSCLIPKPFEEYPSGAALRLGIDHADEALLKRAAIGKIVFSLHCYLGAFLARGEDAVQALHFPGNPALKLTDKQRLALGFVREAIILKHFPSLAVFWETFSRMYQAGKNKARFIDVINFFPPDQVAGLLKDDELAYEMYSVLMKLSCSNGPLSALRINVEYYVDHPMHDTIGDPLLAENMKDGSEDEL